MYTASAISLPPVGVYGLGQLAAEEHPCRIRLVGHRSMQIIDRRQDLRVVARCLRRIAWPSASVATSRRASTFLEAHGYRADATYGQPHMGEVSIVRAVATATAREVRSTRAQRR